MTNSHVMQNQKFLPYMQDVTRCAQSLQELNQMWNLIEASAKMNCPTESRNLLPTITATRHGFSRLEKELIDRLVEENIHNVLTEIGTKARYVIDIITRNLFERTADVGFLATDRVLGDFVAGITTDATAIRYRLREYRDKYSVYDEIILVDASCNVLVQIDTSTPIEHTSDPMIAEALSRDGWVESFGPSDLRPARAQALVYAHRILHPHTSQVTGVLCLCFDFEEEMGRIFGAHRHPHDRFNMLLLDEHNRVIASADPVWIPVGSLAPVNREGDTTLMRYAGRAYFVQTVTAIGYQGYAGPHGWQAQVMMPADIAFDNQPADILNTLPPGMRQGLLSHARTFCPPLHDIMIAAKGIQRIVWNGQVMAAGQHGDMRKLKTILEQISDTGHRSNTLFAHSIQDLYQTVLSSRKNDTIFTTRRLVDLLDRNLYERANDCRWWALTPELASVLADPSPDPGSLLNVTAILDYINSLYTVYTRIYLYDRNGQVIATSGAGQDVVGTMISDATTASVIALTDSQQYHVSGFVPDPMVDNQPTYVYHAAIRHAPDAMPDGGIGIVFDTVPQLHAMLHSALAGQETTDAFYVDRAGYVLASTNPTWPTGSKLPLDPALLQTSRHESHAIVTTFHGQYALIAATASYGYREFKVTDGYRDDVLAVVVDYFGEEVALRPDQQHTITDNSMALQDGIEYATFHSAGHLLAMPATAIVEALPCSEMVATKMGHPAQVGMLPHKASSGQSFIWVFDLHYLMHQQHTAIHHDNQVIIIRDGDRLAGLLVDSLHAVAQFDPHQVTNIPLSAGNNGMFITQILRANEGELLIQAIDPVRLMRHINAGSPDDEPVVLAA